MKVTQEPVWRSNDGRELLRAPSDVGSDCEFRITPSFVSRQELRELVLAIEDALKTGGESCPTT